MRRITAFLIFCFLSLALFSQNSQITVTISKMRAYIGESIGINIVLKSQTDIDKIKTIVNADNFEIDGESGVKSRIENGSKIFEKTIKISFWKTGNFKIKPIIVKTIKNKEIIETISSNKLDIIILSSLDGKKKTEKDLNPIKPLAEIKGSIKYFLKFILILIIIIALIVLIIIFIKKKMKMRISEPESEKTSVEEFEYNYKNLKIKKLYEKGKTKKYFLILTEVIKKFLNREYGFNAEEFTTYETMIEIKKRETDNKVKEKFEFILNLADKVKFAKMKPITDEMEILDKYVKNLIAIYYERQRIAEESERQKAENDRQDK